MLASCRRFDCTEYFQSSSSPSWGKQRSWRSPSRTLSPQVSTKFTRFHAVAPKKTDQLTDGLNITLCSGSTWRPDCKRWDGSSNWEEQRSREDGRRWGEQSLWPPPDTNSEKLLWPCPHIGVTKIWWKVVLQFWELAPTPVGVSQETKPHSSLICPPA